MKVCGRIKLRVPLAHEENNHGDVHSININIGDAEWHFGRFDFVKIRHVQDKDTRSVN